MEKAVRLVLDRGNLSMPTKTHGGNLSCMTCSQSQSPWPIFLTNQNASSLLSASCLPFTKPRERADDRKNILLSEPGSYEVLASEERKLAAAAALTSLPSQFLVDQECNSLLTAAHCRLADIPPCHRSSKRA